MSNMTKAIAVLGVVAGLGVAALPLSSYAAEVVWDAEGAADDSVTNMGGTGSSAWVSTDTTINLEIRDKLSIATTVGSATLTADNANGDADKNIWAANPINVTVITKNAGGYKLTIAGTAGSGENNATVKNALTNETGDMIEAGTLGDADTKSTWGIKVAAGSGEGIVGGTIADSLKNWTLVPAANPAEGENNQGGLTIMSSNKATVEAGETAAVTFGAKIVDGQAAGSYKGRVTFTATNQAKVAAP